ncbi:uncharacterized protein LOC110458195 isoform X2 [Mizuhopecten yessoensis]|uniref:uncharacterized protein LOC110458195 isoform X2 n=1 Tax=Mizuhopecten yessoensis TaxID=6573 RepID=UPI000B45918B|nr:uncharacterized protein LOC110458195 isoform X2 [Mizuhopecten yessoensis]
MASVRIYGILVLFMILLGNINKVCGILERKVGDWQMIFRARSMNGHSVIKTYMEQGVASEQTETAPGCVSINARDQCGNNYRHSMIDRWDSSGVDKVRVELYKEGELVAHIVFNGKGSTSTSWFSQDQVLSSNWFDLKETNTEKGKHFSFLGYSNNNINRRLYINKLWAGGCRLHKGWMVVVEGVTRGQGCGYETYRSYPVFLYIPHTYADYFDDFKSEADVFAISVIAKRVNAV